MPQMSDDLQRQMSSDVLTRMETLLEQQTQIQQAELSKLNQMAPGGTPQVAPMAATSWSAASPYGGTASPLAQLWTSVAGGYVDPVQRQAMFMQGASRLGSSLMGIAGTALGALPFGLMMGAPLMWGAGQMRTAGQFQALASSTQNQLLQPFTAQMQGPLGGLSMTQVMQIGQTMENVGYSNFFTSSETQQIVQQAAAAHLINPSNIQQLPAALRTLMQNVRQVAVALQASWSDSVAFLSQMSQLGLTGPAAAAAGSVFQAAGMSAGMSPMSVVNQIVPFATQLTATTGVPASGFALQSANIAGMLGTLSRSNAVLNAQIQSVGGAPQAALQYGQTSLSIGQSGLGQIMLAGMFRPSSGATGFSFNPQAALQIANSANPLATAQSLSGSLMNSSLYGAFLQMSPSLALSAYQSSPFAFTQGLMAIGRAQAPGATDVQALAQGAYVAGIPLTPGQIQNAVTVNGNQGAFGAQAAMAQALAFADTNLAGSPGLTRGVFGLAGWLSSNAWRWVTSFPRSLWYGLNPQGQHTWEGVGPALSQFWNQKIRGLSPWLNAPGPASAGTATLSGLFDTSDQLLQAMGLSPLDPRVAVGPGGISTFQGDVSRLQAALAQANTPAQRKQIQDLINQFQSEPAVLGREVQSSIGYLGPAAQQAGLGSLAKTLTQLYNQANSGPGGAVSAYTQLQKQLSGLSASQMGQLVKAMQSSDTYKSNPSVGQAMTSLLSGFGGNGPNASQLFDLLMQYNPQSASGGARSGSGPTNQDLANALSQHEQLLKQVLGTLSSESQSMQDEIQQMKYGIPPGSTGTNASTPYAAPAYSQP